VQEIYEGMRNMIAARGHICVTIEVQFLSKAVEACELQRSEEVYPRQSLREAILGAISQLYGRVAYAQYICRPPFLSLEAHFGPLRYAEVSLEDLGESEAWLEVILCHHLPGNDLVIRWLHAEYVA
jgi:hypothetical protein